jgi:hypothetical protein
MAQPRRRSRARRPTVLLSVILAGVFVVCSIGNGAQPAFDPSNASWISADNNERSDSVTRAVKADQLGLLRISPTRQASAFDRIWNADDPSRPADMAVAPPVVFFAWADPVGSVDVPFDVLAEGSDVSAHGWGIASLSASGSSDGETTCLASAIYFEARGEGRLGELAVAQVVINRVKDPAFPKTICGVVYQNANELHRCQFSFACDGVADRITDKASWREALDVAEGVLKNPSEMVLADVGNSTHYHATFVSPQWARKMKLVDMIGHHVFYASYGNGSS